MILFSVLFEVSLIPGYAVNRALRYTSQFDWHHHAFSIALCMSFSSAPFTPKVRDHKLYDQPDLLSRREF